MDTVDYLIAGLRKDPDDLTGERALTDALVEVRDMQPTEAAEHARRTMQELRDARDLSAAAELLRADQDWHTELVHDIIRYCFLDPMEGANIVVVCGDSFPVAATEHQPVGGGYFRAHTITVGALWVIRHWRNNPSLCLRFNETRRYRRRPR